MSLALWDGLDSRMELKSYAKHNITYADLSVLFSVAGRPSIFWRRVRPGR